MIEKPPALDPAMVHEIVSLAHTDLEGVSNLLDKQPNLINSSWDWGGGDWETPLGAASHMGRRDIAGYLLARGARMDVFCAAMLGKMDIVNSALEDNPNVVLLLGPHGISLLDHAVAGGSNEMVALIRHFL